MKNVCCQIEMNQVFRGWKEFDRGTVHLVAEFICTKCGNVSSLGMPPIPKHCIDKKIIGVNEL